jgi:chaperonin GroES
MIQPIRNNVLVKCLEGSGVSEGGIYVPDSYKKDSNKVEVIAVGRGTNKKPMRLKVGDVGFRVKDWGQEIMEDGQKYYIMDDSAIIALN